MNKYHYMKNKIQYLQYFKEIKIRTDIIFLNSEFYKRNTV